MNPCTPYVAPPILRGEVRFRPIFIGLEGKVEDSTTGFSRDFLKELGYVNQGILFEYMARAQIGRVSLRAHYDSYIRTFRGHNSRLDWPEFHLGGDLDLMYTEPIRLGLDMDFYVARPEFRLEDPVLGAINIAAPRPATVGGHIVLNPVSIGRLSVSMEVRARRSIRTGTRINEYEIAAGLKTPETVLGTVALRGGFRYSDIGLEHENIHVDVQWKGGFGELVYYY